jgi:hypothetical protein
VAKAEQTVDDIRARPQACWQKAAKHEIHEIRATKGLSEDGRIKDRDN